MENLNNKHKYGRICGFFEADDEMLEIIIRDLKLEATVDDLKYLRAQLSSAGKLPSASELIFLSKAMKSGGSSGSDALIYSVSSSKLEIPELFERLASEYREKSGNTLSLPLLELAGFALSDGEKAGNGITLSEAALPVSPLPSSEKTAVFGSLEDGKPDILMTLSGSSPVQGPGGDTAFMIYPLSKQDVFSFLINAPAFLSWLSENVSCSVIPMTGKGFIRDLSEQVCGAEIITSNLAKATGTAPGPGLLLKSFCPAYLLFTDTLNLSRIQPAALAAGFGCLPVAVRCGSINEFISHDFGDSFSIPYGLTERISYSRYITSRAEPEETKKPYSPELASNVRYPLEARVFSSPAFEDLKALSDEGVPLAVYGKLAPMSHGCIPLILTLAAWKKECSPDIAAFKFSEGDENKITVFKIGKGSSGHLPATALEASGIGTIFPYDEPHAVSAAPSNTADTATADSPDNVNSGERNLKKQMNDQRLTFDFTSLPGRGRIYNNSAELCGSTPLLRVYPELPARLLYKLELFNPAGSAKDRIALGMLKDAAASGVLKPGGTVIEPTSGNTGIGLAAYGVPMGYKVIIVMPDSMSKERIALIKAYGAEIVLTPGSEGMSGAIKKAEELKASIPGSIIASQFDNPANPASHYSSTGPEIWKDTCGQVDILVSGIGTGGTLCGTARYLKEKNPRLISVACEPLSSPLIKLGRSGPHKIQGIGANFIPANFDASVVDFIADVSDEDAINETVKIARDTGILVGISSGCAAAEARRLASLPENAGKTIVAILPDTGEHYISTGIFD